VSGWPIVDLITSHGGARGAVVAALVGAGAQGLVVAGTGNGTVHAEWESALARAAAAGVVVWRGTRCGGGVVVGPAGDEPGGEPGDDARPRPGDLAPVKARIELMLRLLARQPQWPA
jgi:L-asparaginase